MSTRVYIGGEIHDEKSASVSVFDRGFLYGDSVYEVTRTSGGRPVDLDRHLDRLGRSAAGILMRVPAREELAAAVGRTLAEAANPESYIRIIVTRGAGDVGLDPALADEPRLLVIVRPLRRPDERVYREGASVAIVDVPRTAVWSRNPAVKSGNYLNNIMALAEAKRAGAHEALLCNAAGRVVEGASSNVFVVDGGGTVRTPALEDGLLDGITRGRVIELARAEGLRVEECHLEPRDVRSAAEVFITSAIRGVLPVARVDGVLVAGGAPGASTRQVMALYDRFLYRVAAGAL